MRSTKGTAGATPPPLAMKKSFSSPSSMARSAGGGTARDGGATMLEVLVAMLVIGLVATGIVTAFIFSRQVTWRSSTELSSAGLVREVAEALRSAVSRPIAAGPKAGLTLAPGVYRDDNMPNPPAGAVTLPVGGGGVNPLNLPVDFRRFQDPASGVAGATVAAANHGDGRLVVVEDAGEDRDGDGQSGLDLDGDGVTDLRRVRIRLKFTSPTS